MDNLAWTNYPPELLEQAAQREAEAQAALLARPPVIEDPYNVSLWELLKRWYRRRRNG